MIYVYRHNNWAISCVIALIGCAIMVIRHLGNKQPNVVHCLPWNMMPRYDEQYYLTITETVFRQRVTTPQLTTGLFSS